MFPIRNRPSDAPRPKKLDPLEKGDFPAMIFAALVTLFPALVLVGGTFLFVFWLFFLRFA